jgi:hypothetical protein
VATYTLSQDQLNDLRGDMDIDVGAVFTDAELNRLYNRAEGNYEYTVALAWRQVLASASKMTDYKAAQSSESLSQLYTHIKAMVEYWTGLSGLGGFALEGGLISLNTDATTDNQSEWDGTQDIGVYPGYEF